MAGLLEEETEVETVPEVEPEAETAPNLYPPMLSVVTASGASAASAASVVDVVGGVGAKNREQNGQGVRNAHRDAGADAVSDAVADALSGLNRDAMDLRAVRRAVAAGACTASVRSVRAHFGWRTERAARALRALRTEGGGRPRILNEWALRHVVYSPDCTVKLSLWRDDATRAGFTQTVAYSERLRVGPHRAAMPGPYRVTMAGLHQAAMPGPV